MTTDEFKKKMAELEYPNDLIDLIVECVTIDPKIKDPGHELDWLAVEFASTKTSRAVWTEKRKKKEKKREERFFKSLRASVTKRLKELKK